MVYTIHTGGEVLTDFSAATELTRVVVEQTLYGGCKLYAI